MVSPELGIVHRNCGKIRIHFELDSNVTFCMHSNIVVGTKFHGRAETYSLDNGSKQLSNFMGLCFRPLAAYRYRSLFQRSKVYQNESCTSSASQCIFCIRISVNRIAICQQQISMSACRLNSIRSKVRLTKSKNRPTWVIQGCFTTRRRIHEK